MKRMLIHALREMVTNEEKAIAMNDKELTDALIDRVWAKFDLTSIESALVKQAIDRLRELP